MPKKLEPKDIYSIVYHKIMKKLKDSGFLDYEITDELNIECQNSNSGRYYKDVKEILCNEVFDAFGIAGVFVLLERKEYLSPNDMLQMLKSKNLSHNEKYEIAMFKKEDSIGGLQRLIEHFDKDFDDLLLVKVLEKNSHILKTIYNQIDTYISLEIIGKKEIIMHPYFFGNDNHFLHIQPLKDMEILVKNETSHIIDINCLKDSTIYGSLITMNIASFIEQNEDTLGVEYDRTHGMHDVGFTKNPNAYVMQSILLKTPITKEKKEEVEKIILKVLDLIKDKKNMKDNDMSIVYQSKLLTEELKEIKLSSGGKLKI